MDLDEPADVRYRQDLSPDVEGGEGKKPFETIVEAVRFVMETLAEGIEPIRADNGLMQSGAACQAAPLP
jgi:hypothetical protein